MSTRSRKQKGARCAPGYMAKDNAIGGGSGLAKASATKQQSVKGVPCSRYPTSTVLPTRINHLTATAAGAV
jgi:hypothetical protein